jgi:hypothetical protein
MGTETCRSQSVSSGLFIHVMLWRRMSCVLVQHHVKMIMITDASYLKTRGIKSPPDISKLHHFNTVLHYRDHKASSTVTGVPHCGICWVGQYCFVISCQTCRQTRTIIKDPPTSAYYKYNNYGLDMLNC